MGYFYKKTVLLNQVTAGYSLNGGSVKGIVKLQKNLDSVTISISTINLANVEEGKYVVLISNDNGNLFEMQLNNVNTTITKSISGELDIEQATLIVLVLKTDYQTIPIATASTKQTNVTIKELINRYDEETANVPTQESYQAEGVIQPKERQASSSEEIANNEIYQDDIVVTENYYMNGDVDLESLNIKNNIEGCENDSKYQYGENAKYETNDNKEHEIRAKTQPIDQDEAGGGNGNSYQTFSKRFEYYYKIENQLKELFEKYQSYDALNNLIPNSKWVKIDYDNNNFYVVGVIYDNDKPLYISYGVAGEYGKKPSELKDYCTFIPSSVYQTKTKGYYLMYQSVDDGNIKTFN